MRWLYWMIFLEKWKGWLFGEAKQPSSLAIEGKNEKLLYQVELECLIHYLQGQLQERVYHSRSGGGRVIIGTISDTIAELSVHPKGESRDKVFVVVRLEDEFLRYKVWFQLAFVAYNVHFGKPTLTLKRSWEAPRGR